MRYHQSMAIRLNSLEQEVLDYLLSKNDSCEATEREVAEHFRGKHTSTKILNILDSIYQKGWTTKRWPNWHTIRPGALIDGTGAHGRVDLGGGKKEKDK